MIQLRSSFLAFALLALPATSFAAPTIAGGTDVTGDDPIARTTVGLVSVYAPEAGSNEPGYGLCTTSILAKDIAVTAAHCVEGAEKAVLVFGTSLEKAQIVRPAKILAIHPAYSAKDSVNDVALIKFDGDLPEGFEPIQMVPTSEVIERGDVVTLSGFGITDLGTQEGSGILRKVDEIVYGTDVLEKGTVLFANRKNTGACPGDSGGPALLKTGEKYMLLGVASYLLKPSELPCGIASVYTDLRADSIRGFIEATMPELQKQ